HTDNSSASENRITLLEKRYPRSVTFYYISLLTAVFLNNSSNLSALVVSQNRSYAAVFSVPSSKACRNRQKLFPSLYVPQGAYSKSVLSVNLSITLKGKGLRSILVPKTAKS